MAAYTRCLRCAGAPRRPAGGPGFRCSFLPGMPSSMTPGSSTSIYSRAAMSTWPSPRSERLGTPKIPAIRFTRGTLTRLHWFASATACQVARPPVRIKPASRPPGAFTSGLPTRRIPLPDMTTTVTGLLCWRVSHPLEWQLASLHQIPACAANAPGSSLGFWRRSGDMAVGVVS